MPKLGRLQFDEIGNWSEIKLSIIKEYSGKYTTIVGSASGPGRGLHSVYIDAFAGTGVHISKQSGELVPGSPLNALYTEPPFRELHLIDLDRDKSEHLQQIVDELGESQRVTCYAGDCNSILPRQVYPQVRREDFRRGVLFLDPYGLHLHWETVSAAAALGTLDVFINLPVMDMNRNAFWRNYGGADPLDLERMDQFWGDGTWRDVVYQEPPQLQWGFVQGPELEKVRGNVPITQGYQQRLQEVAGFKYVPDPIGMTNSRGGIVYYLYFASHNEAANRIATGVFRKYRKEMANNGR